MISSSLFPGVRIAFICACVWQIASPGLADAARPDGLDARQLEDPRPPVRHKSGVAVQKIQEALAEMGYYLGHIDGHLNPETTAAVRVYQKAMGLEVDGEISRQLWDFLNNAVEVRSLIKRLDTARKAGKDKARAALLAHTATQDLITDTDRERANPVRNADACFAEPTVRCLLTEARESVKAVFKPELRDWALGEILVAQARAGLSDWAMDTAGGIRDPRLIIVALRDIAKAQAAAGNSAQALEAVNIIPDAEKRAEALATISQIHARQGDKLATRAAASALLAMIEEVQPPTKQISLKMQVALVFHQTGSPIRTNQLLTSSETQSRALADEKQRLLGLRHIATTLASLGRAADALKVLVEITEKSERDPVLMAIAKAMADRGETEQALKTAETIEPRYRATILSHILDAQSVASPPDELRRTLSLAEQTIELIKLPYARSYAQSRLALTVTRLGNVPGQRPDAGTGIPWPRFTSASEIAAKIADHRLRAYTLWSIASQQRRAGDDPGAQLTEAQADKTTNDISSRLSRVWMFADLAAQQARQGDTKTGWDAFNRGLKIGKSIDNAWSRARALAKLAQTLIELIAPGRGQEDDPFAN
ncbi:MAG: peptidoglycan-binding protein [Rhodospirillales bacterium]|nr:peptidoglycan-binding protein [Rhodospirillales bacterium]